MTRTRTTRSAAGGDSDVSAIVPVYNGAAHLGAAIESILAQREPVREIIVVDDGSTDGSADVARSYPQVRCLVQPNRGCASARNAGIAAASGALLAFLDADDLWTPDKLAVQVAFLRAHPECAYVLARQELFLDGIAAPPWLRPAHLAHDQAGILPSTLVIRARLFERVGLFDTSYQVASDVEWFARAKDAGIGMVILPQVLLRRRVHAGNLTSAVRRNHTALLRLLKASIDRRREDGE